MTDEEYQSAQNEIIAAALTIEKIPLDAFLARLDRGAAIAPIIDPTLFMKAADNLRAIRRVAESMVPVRDRAIELRTAFIETMVRGDMELERKPLEHDERGWQPK